MASPAEDPQLLPTAGGQDGDEAVMGGDEDVMVDDGQHSLAAAPGLPCQEEAFSQGSTWDPVWAHAQSHDAVSLMDCNVSICSGEWEVVTDTCKSLSACGSPARSIATDNSSSSRDQALDSLPTSWGPAQGQALTSFGQFPHSITTAVPLLGPPGSEPGPERDMEAHYVTHPNSEVNSVHSFGSADTESPNSADIAIAGAEMHVDSPALPSPGENTCPVLEAAHEVSNVMLAGIVRERTPNATVQNFFATCNEADDMFVFGNVGSTIHHLWEWMGVFTSCAGRWTAGRLSTIHCAARALGGLGGPRNGPQKIAKADADAAEGKPSRSVASLQATIYVMGCTSAVLGGCLVSYMMDNRRLQSKVLQRDRELAALVMKVFSLQESLQGGRRFPVICQAMSPLKQHAYM